MHYNTKFGYKRLPKNTQPTGKKYLSHALLPSPLKTPSRIPFCMHRTQRKKLLPRVS